MVFIRVDGNAAIGTGHVMRCLSLAYELKNLGEEVLFVTADTTMHTVIKQIGMRVFSLDSDWRFLEGELSAFLSFIKEENPSWVIVDSYYAKMQYIEEISTISKVCVFDDFGNETYACPVLVNYNIYADKLDYPRRYTECVQLLLGPAYAPLRQEFTNLPVAIVRQNSKKILLTTGGSDPLGTALQIVDAFGEALRNEQLELHVVAGAMHPAVEALREKTTLFSAMHLHINVTTMSQLMQQCDVAISAGGSTLYELCACGLPTVLFTLADNQLPAAKAFSSKGLMAYAGDVRENTERCVQSIVKNVLSLLDDPVERQKKATGMQKLVDGKGAERIAKIICGGTVG